MYGPYLDLYIVPGRYHTLIKDCSYLPGDNAEGIRHIQLRQYKFIATLSMSYFLCTCTTHPATD